MVIASADRFIDNRHFCRNSNKTAEISVPACPIPTHHTKLVISQAQPTVLLSPQTPIPVPMVYAIQPRPHKNAAKENKNKAHHHLLAFPSTGRAMSSVMSCSDLSSRISGSLIGDS